MWIYFVVAAAAAAVGAALYNRKIHDLQAGDLVRCSLSDFLFPAATPFLTEALRVANGFVSITVQGTDEPANEIAGTFDVSKVMPMTGLPFPVRVRWSAGMQASRGGKPFIANGPLHIKPRDTATPFVVPPPAATPATSVEFPDANGAFFIPGSGRQEPLLPFGLSTVPSAGVATLVTAKNPDATPSQIASVQQSIIDALNTPQTDRTPEQLAILLAVASLPPAPQLDVLQAAARTTPSGNKVLADVASMSSPEQLAALQLASALLPPPA